MIDGIDFAQLPIWIGVLVIILNFLRTPLAKLFPFLKAKAVARAEVEEIIAEGRRQDEVAEKLLLTRLIEQALTQNKGLIDIITTRITAQLDTIDNRLVNITNEHRNMQQQLDKLVNDR